MQDRRVIAAAVTQTAPPSAAKARDPVLSALPRSGKTALVIEANAIRNSPLGELLIGCMSARGGGDFSRIREELGIDVLTDLDRVAISEEGLILAGNFKGARWDKMQPGASARAYRENSVVYAQASSDEQMPRGGEVVGRWGDQMIVVGDSVGQLHSILDRVESPQSSEPPAIPEDATYGEIYGVLAVDELAKLVPGDEAALRDGILGAAQHIELHVDTRDDVSIVAQVRGSDPAKLADLEKLINGLLSAARIRAQAQQDSALPDLLDLARVVPRANQLDVELALPLEFLKRHLAWCTHPDGLEDTQTVRN
jgi:hypothetical protein